MYNTNERLDLGLINWKSKSPPYEQILLNWLNKAES